jgi:hypothetical protein
MMKNVLRAVLAAVAFYAAIRVSYWLAPDDVGWLHYVIFFTVGMPLLVAVWKIFPFSCQWRSHANWPTAHILGAIAEFERERIRERVVAGLRRSWSQGKRLGRPQVVIPFDQVRRLEGLTADVAARPSGSVTLDGKAVASANSAVKKQAAPSKREAALSLHGQA